MAGFGKFASADQQGPGRCQILKTDSKTEPTLRKDGLSHELHLTAEPGYPGSVEV